MDRRYYIKVNDYRSPTFASAVGIPKGSVISPILCTLYTSDSMEEVEGNHAELADDASVCNSDESVQEVCSATNRDRVNEQRKKNGVKCGICL